jgi:hypothetical protein
MRANDKDRHDRINEIVHRMNDFHGLVLSKLALLRNYVSDRVGTVISHCTHCHTKDE